MRKYKVVLDHEVSCTYIIDAEDDADLIKECQFSHLQKQSSNVKHIRTDDELRKIGGWKDISNVK